MYANQISFQCLFCKKNEINVSVTKNRTTNFSLLIFVHVKNWKKKRPPLLFSFENPKDETKKFHIWLLCHWLMQWKKLKTSIFRILVVLPKTHFFVNNEKLNLNIFVTLFEHSTSMHHQEIASSNMTKDRRQQSRVKRQYIYIRTVSS